MKFTFLICCLASSCCVLAQLEKNTSATNSLTDVTAGSVDWGDYDNDGDLDLALSGTAGVMLAAVYRNDSGTFTDIEAGLPGVDQGTIAWADYDGDGDLDILLTGMSSTPVDLGGGNTGNEPLPVTAIFRNDDGVFTDIEAGLLPLTNSAAAWGDYDNDGDPDIALFGYEEAANLDVFKVYRNDDGVFTDIAVPIVSTAGNLDGSLAWGDYDNDDDLDLLVAGLAGEEGTVITALYRNDDGAFVNTGAAIEGVAVSAVAWSDYDRDNDLDFALTGGRNDGTFTAMLYRNDGGTFTDAGVTLVNVQFGSLTWGDYDMDGDPDLLLAGLNEADFLPVTKLYKNDSGVLTDADAGFEGLMFSDAAWGDYDNDGDPDLVYTGMDKDNAGRTEVFENILNPNRAPVAILLDNNTIDENREAGTLVGNLTGTDPDEGDMHTFQLAAGEGDTDNGSFRIAGSELQSNETFDYETKAVYSIRVEANDGNGGVFQQVLAVTINNMPDQLGVPNAFSPNGDGVNDTWQLTDADLFPGIEVSIFDREGQQVFFSKGYSQAWDGTLHGNALSVATYFYAINLNNASPVLQGSVTIVQ